jgi:polyhydroxyalkanoate synthesis regulator phasin
MAERKRSTGGRSGSGKSRPSASSRSRSSSSRASSARKAAAKKGGQARGRQQRARKQADKASRGAAAGARRAGVEAKTVAEFREALRKNLIRPLDLVMLTRDRIEEVLEEAVGQGNVTAKDARKIATGLVDRGRKQTNDVMKDLEQLLGRGRDEIEGRTSGARKRGEKAAKSARSRAVKAADPALVQADRVRRAAGVGPNFPITAYDELTAAQVQGRLGDLKAAQLRKVRDHERRNANRKSVLNAIEQKLK